jgi:hypothetical protein
MIEFILAYLGVSIFQHMKIAVEKWMVIPVALIRGVILVILITWFTNWALQILEVDFVVNWVQVFTVRGLLILYMPTSQKFIDIKD